MAYSHFISQSTENYLRSQFPIETTHWMSTFDAQVMRLIDKWKLTLSGHEALSRFGTIFYAHSEPYGDVAVKIVPHFSPRLEGEIACYRALPYVEMCPLYDVDEVMGALLLKFVRCERARPIAEVQERVFSSLRAQRKRACSERGHFDDYCEVLESVLSNAERELKLRKDDELNALNKSISRAREAMRIFDADERYIIHGDAHEYNMLTEADACVLIDPLGYTAPFVFEYARYIGTKLKPAPLAPETLSALITRLLPPEEDRRRALWAMGVDTTLRSANTFIEGNTYQEILESVNWAERAWQSVDALS